MNIELLLTELETIISKSSGRPVQLKSVGKNQVEVHYIVSVTLTLTEVKPQGAVFHYATNQLVGMMIKGMKGKIREQLDKLPFLAWDEEKELITVDLAQLPAAGPILAHAAIDQLSFDDGKALISIKAV